jgi:hypothetical protein
LCNMHEGSFKVMYTDKLAMSGNQFKYSVQLYTPSKK